MVVLNAARALGKVLKEADVRAHTATIEQGTTEHGIKNALERLGFSHADFTFSVGDRTWLVIQESIKAGNPVILSVDNQDHWIVAIGVVGDRLVVFDSWFAKWNRNENGVHVMTKAQVIKWMRYGENQFYGMCVSRPRKK